MPGPAGSSRLSEPLNPLGYMVLSIGTNVLTKVTKC
jgi:hypothetical protein